jgi:hypothetical protein
MKKRMLIVMALMVGLAAFVVGPAQAAHHESGENLTVVYDGFDGPGNGKHIVLLSGDEEYRSEETMPQFGKILARRHGFKCTVLFSLNEEGFIDPENQKNVTGLEALEDADLAIMFFRFRRPPADQAKYIEDYLNSGKPIIGMRTSTHAFNYRSGPYKKWADGSEEEGWDGGFGRQVFGEQWISHWGYHGRESTRGLLADGQEDHPILRGIEDGDIWGTTDVYEVRKPMMPTVQPLVMGQVLDGMFPDDEPVDGEKNDNMMPVSWTNAYTGSSGKTNKVFNTTMGASQDFARPGTRRMMVNAVYWALGMEDQIPEGGTDVRQVGHFRVTPFGFGTHTVGIRPSDHNMEQEEDEDDD